MNYVELFGFEHCSMVTFVATIMDFPFTCRITLSASEEGFLLQIQFINFLDKLLRFGRTQTSSYPIFTNIKL
jgi:hypothetical protein